MEVGNVYNELAILTDDVSVGAADLGAVESTSGAVRSALGRDPDGYRVTLLEYSDFIKEQGS